MMVIGVAEVEGASEKTREMCTVATRALIAMESKEYFSGAEL